MKKERDKTIDIIRGILICLVVIGHVVDSQSKIHQYIYSFHMPCFFLISGYLNRNSLTIEEKNYLKKIITRYIRPYFIYSTIFLVLTGMNFKNAIRMFLGGRLNVTVYSYAFWFINVLVLSLLVIKTSLNKISFRYLCIIACVFWMLAHFLESYLQYICLPWGIEFLPITIFYMTVGMIIRKMDWYTDSSIRIIKKIFFIISIVLTVWFIRYNEIYLYDLNGYILGNGLNDILIPIIAFYSLGFISELMTKSRIITTCFEYIGKASFVVFFLHTLLIFCFKKIFTESILTDLMVAALCIVVCTTIYYLMDQNEKLGIYFLGKE